MMELFKADLHIHSVLSPCGSLEMSPGKIVEKAREEGINILGISDHNSTRQCHIIKRIAEKEDIFVLCGAEVTTKEEVHCLVYFETAEALDSFEEFVCNHLLPVKNDPEKFGYQVVVDEDEMIREQVEKLLISATDLSIEELEMEVHKRGGLFIPAHIDRVRYGIIGQLGFIPEDLRFDALELSKFTSYSEFINRYPLYADEAFIFSSDAHLLNEIGTTTTEFLLDHPSFREIKLALDNSNGRKVIIEK